MTYTIIPSPHNHGLATGLSLDLSIPSQINLWDKQHAGQIIVLVKPSKRKAKKTNSATHRSYRHTSYKRNGGVRKRAINTSESSGGFTPNNTEKTPQTVPIPTTHTARIRIRPRDLWTGSWLRAPPPPSSKNPAHPLNWEFFVEILPTLIKT